MKYINYILSPFKENRHIFILFLILTTLIDFINAVTNNQYGYSIYLFSHGYITSYLITLIYIFFPNKFYKISILTIPIIFFIIDLFCNFYLEEQFNNRLAGIIFGTNFNEAIEFLQTFLTIKFILIIVSILTFLILIINLVKKYKTKNYSSITTLLSIIFLISIILCIKTPYLWEKMLFGKIYILANTPSTPDLRNYRSNLKLISTTNNKPQNIVIILGESFSKLHSSLYGYNKETNPYLSSLRDSSSLFIFNHVTSSALNTIEAIKSIMTTYNPNKSNNTREWYECEKLPDIIKQTGYYTFWISNQSQYGLYDNIASAFAKLCDTTIFVGDLCAGVGTNKLDENIIPCLQQQINNNNSLNCYFIHLIGSHYSFNRRYPKHFNKYSPNDYCEYPKHQRYNLATYDNSILYNDSVVYKIINLFQNKESIVFYFSDHSIDLYNSSSDYIGHAKGNVPKSADAGHQIPFMIYTSKKFNKNNPQTVKRIKENINTPFCTNNFIYTIMDITGVNFENNKNNINRSLFKN